MMEYSPGPWEEKITHDGLVWVLMPDGHRVSIGDMEETCGICHANSRLIAKAPQMYSALLKIAVLSDPLITDEDTFSVQLDVINELAEEVKALIVPTAAPD